MRDISRKSQQLLVMGAMLAAAIAFGLWLFFWVEWEEEEIDLGYSEEAQRNAFLAAQQFLAERDIAVEVVKSFSIFDTMAYKNNVIGPHDTIVLVGAYGVLEGDRLNNLWQWLESGGNLVISTGNPFVDASAQSGDALFRRLPVYVVIDSGDEEPSASGKEPSAPDKEPSASKEEPSASKKEPPASDTDASSPNENPAAAEGESADKTVDDKEAVDQCDLLQKASLIHNLQSGVDFEIADMDGYPVDYTGDFQPLWNGESSPQRMLRFEQGAGTVTVSADNTLWRNDTIACFDHAYALAALARGSNKVWFVINVDAPSLWRVLWQAAPAALILLALALGGWLWAIAKRFVPAITVPKTSRRSFLEHVRASAMFLWRQKRGPQLIEHLRHDILQLVARRYPDFSEKDVSQKIEFICHSTGLSEAEVDAALFHPAPVTPAGFTLNVKRLQQIRNTL